MTKNELLEKSSQCIDNKDFDCCIKYLEIYVEKSPKEPEPRNNLSICYNNRGVSWSNDEWKKAIADYNKAIRHNPNNRRAIVNKSVEYHNQRDFEGAIGTGELIINENIEEKDREQLYVVLMSSHENTGGYFEALEYARLGDTQFPDNVKFAESRKRINQLNGNRVPEKPRWKVEVEKTTRELIQDYRNAGNINNQRMRLGILRDPDTDKNTIFFDKQIENTIVPLVAQANNLFDVIPLNRKDFMDVDNFLRNSGTNTLQVDLLLRIDISRQDKNILITIKLTGAGGKLLSQRGVTVQHN